MNHSIVQLIMAFTGSMGFCLLFHVRLRLLMPAALGGFLSWGIYLAGMHFTSEIFLPTLITSAFSALYAEVMARICKTPATVFFIPALIPLIPGSALYYTMSFLVQGDLVTAREFASSTAQYALGIAAGASLVWGLVDVVRSFCAAIFSKKDV